MTMRTILLSILLASAACGGAKKSPAAPPQPGETKATDDSDMKDEARPDDADDAGDPMRADPCDGGE